MISIIRFFAFVIAFTAFSTAWAKDLYVSPTGSDNYTYALNDIDHPWATPKRAWGASGVASTECAKSGDTVYFRAGTYVIGETINTKYYGNHGTEQSPILFKNFKGEQVIFDGGQLDYVFKIEKDWNIIEGIRFTGGKTVFLFGYDLTVNGGTVRNCQSIRALGGDNTGFVYANSTASGISVINCKIVGPGLMSSGVHQNTAGVIAFNSRGLKVKNCEILNVPIGIYYKHGQKLLADTGIELSFNYIHDTDRYCIELNANYALVHDNIFEGPNGSFRINEDNGGAGGDYNTVDHNTFINTGLVLSADLGGALYNKITNNIIGGVVSIHRYSTLPHNSQTDFNVYPPDIILYEYNVSYAPDQWKAISKWDQKSQIGIPTFVGGSKSLGLGRLELASGVGKAGGSDLKDIGASAKECGVIIKAPLLYISPPK